MHPATEARGNSKNMEELSAVNTLQKPLSQPLDLFVKTRNDRSHILVRGFPLCFFLYLVLVLSNPKQPLSQLWASF